MADNGRVCNRYAPPSSHALVAQWNARVSDRLDLSWPAVVFPRARGPFLRAGAQPGNPELAVGQWGLIPHFAKSAKLPYQTNNARSEDMANKPSFRDAWRRGQRCIIPAVSFDEPCWESGKNVWWRFSRADGLLWGLAGLWNTWVDPSTGEVLGSYTMLTINADAHPLMRRMHKPDLRLPVDAQDKRSVVAIEPSDSEAWLHGSTDIAQDLIRLSPECAFKAAPLTVA